MAPQLTVVVLISGNGSNLQAIIDQLHGTDAPVTIAAVISNKEQAYGLQRARQAGIPTHVVKHEDFPQRLTFDQKLIELIDNYEPRLVILAGFMRILSAEFVQHYKNRLINIHPSLLPKFRGLNTHARALAAGETEHGASVHFVTEDLDSGPVVLQATVNILDNDTAKSLAQRVLQKEYIIYPMVILWIAQGRLHWDREKLIFDGAEVSTPMRLDDSA